MPSNVVHNYFARRVLNGLDSPIQELINGYKDAFLVGAQGPDLLFYLRFEEEPLNKLGVMIHNSFRAHEMFTRAAQYIREENDSAVFAFILGQLCHYMLDANIHPYVYHRELDLPRFYTKGAHEYIHVVFESALDYICVKDYLKKNTMLYKGYKNLNINKKSRERVARYYSIAVAPLYDMSLPEVKAIKMIKLMRLYLRICDDMTGFRYLIIRGIEKIMGESRNVSAFIRPRKESKEQDWLNINRTPYPKYKGELELSTLTVEEMAKNAYNEAVTIINDFYKAVKENIALDKILYYRNYGGEREEKR